MACCRTAIGGTFGSRRETDAGVTTTGRKLRNTANTIGSFAIFSTTSAIKESRWVKRPRPGTRSRTNEGNLATLLLGPNCRGEASEMEHKNYDPSTFLHWYRKLSCHPDSCSLVTDRRMVAQRTSMGHLLVMGTPACYSS